MVNYIEKTTFMEHMSSNSDQTTTQQPKSHCRRGLTVCNLEEVLLLTMHNTGLMQERARLVSPTNILCIGMNRLYLTSTAHLRLLLQVGYSLTPSFRWKDYSSWRMPSERSAWLLTLGKLGSSPRRRTFTVESLT
jgi:hypothetical protein